jgi:hypothetical protein
MVLVLDILILPMFDGVMVANLDQLVKPENGKDMEGSRRAMIRFADFVRAIEPGEVIDFVPNRSPSSELKSDISVIYEPSMRLAD